MNPQKVGWLHRSALFTVALVGVRKVDETESGIISEEALQDHHGAVMPPHPPHPSVQRMLRAAGRSSSSRHDSIIDPLSVGR